jgi:hypothetical protein
MQFFSGFYPYFKLGVILWFSVIQQRPQSKALQVMDTIGKYSLIDSFLVVLMVRGLDIPGLTRVNLLSSYFFTWLGPLYLWPSVTSRRGAGRPHMTPYPPRKEPA